LVRYTGWECGTRSAPHSPVVPETSRHEKEEKNQTWHDKGGPKVWVKAMISGKSEPARVSEPAAISRGVYWTEIKVKPRSNGKEKTKPWDGGH